MVIYLTDNCGPYITLLVNQCIQFVHCPKDSCVIEIKRTFRYFHDSEIKISISN